MSRFNQDDIDTFQASNDLHDISFELGSFQTGLGPGGYRSIPELEYPPGPNDSIFNMDESFYEDLYDDRRTSAHYSDREIDEMADRWYEEQEWEDQLRGLDPLEARGTFWDSFQEQKFPPEKSGKKSRVRFH
jgi:hypothetical protein